MRDQKYRKDSRCTHWHDWFWTKKGNGLVTNAHVWPWTKKWVEDSRFTNEHAWPGRKTCGRGGWGGGKAA